MTEKQTPSPDQTPREQLYDHTLPTEQPIDFLSDTTPTEKPPVTDFLAKAPTVAEAKTPVTEFLPEDIPVAPPVNFLKLEDEQKAADSFAPHANAARDLIGEAPVKTPPQPFLDDEKILELGNDSRNSSRDSFEAFAAQGAEQHDDPSANTVPTFEAFPSQQTEHKKPNFFRRKSAAAATTLAVVAGAATGVALVNNAMKPDHFSEQTNTYTVPEGGSLTSAVNTIEGIDHADKRDAIAVVESDPANTAVLKDGVLQPGEQLQVPQSVEGYDESNK